jgi:hypothetical protein
MKPSDELIEACANQIVDDIINNGDISAIIELLRYCPAEKLVYYLPEDEWKKFMREVKIDEIL